MSDEPSGRKRRKLKNFLIRPKQQVRILLLLFSFGVVLLTSFVSFFFILLRNTIQSFESSTGVAPEIGQSLIYTVHWATIGMALVSVLLLIFLGSIVVITHRFYGPLVPILRTLGELKAGNYSGRVHLRKGDELHDLMDAINSLAEELEKRHPTP